MSNDLDFTGAWFTRKGVRLELQPDGRYGKVTPSNETYAGRYNKDGARIEFINDNGKRVRGRMMQGVLTIGPHLYLRDWAEAAAPAPAPQRAQANGLMALAHNALAWALPQQTRVLE